MAFCRMMSVLAMALAGILILLVTSSVADTCSGYKGCGVPGIPGTHGPNGKDGDKGQKGDHGLNGLLVKGQKGDPGLLGAPGRSGQEGDLGLPGMPGLAGPKGEKGIPRGVSVAKKSFFSSKKLSKRFPTKDSPIEFDRAVMEGDPLQKGVFRSATKGYYYFTFHVSGRAMVCLNIKKGTVTMVGFCDSAERGYLVTSGSVVLKLEVGDEVSVQTNENNSVMSGSGADSIFTGFLLFPIS
ncbi:hypothetical protein AAFF_G00313520 [Aldrovandia affinis]|uniref:C1q domain-containing protein n=1 Tax=Aldrovandia affinis TaxID=143900 RepID=A0AAD7WR26_9TELE|nr:hypothetical protein AAFF_G00313520 [Aldrovandia affinis]